jgi:hypothetical protein
MIDKRTITRTGRTYDIRLFDGPELAGGDLSLSREAAVAFIRDECGLNQYLAEDAAYNADQIEGRPYEFWV